MSGVSATGGVGLSWSSTQTKDCRKQKPITISSKPSHNLPLQKLIQQSQKRHHICRAHHSLQTPISLSSHHLSSSITTLPNGPFSEILNNSHSGILENLILLDLDPATAKVAIGFLGPFLSAFGFLFILRIVMSWYPKLPVEEFPYVLAYAPTEPILVQTRKVIPPVGGVDVTPVVWFGLLSFLNEILVGPQGLLVLLSQQVS